MPNNGKLMHIVDSMSEDKQFQEMHWEGTFEEYLDIVDRIWASLRSYVE